MNIQVMIIVSEIRMTEITQLNEWWLPLRRKFASDCSPTGLEMKSY